VSDARRGRPGALGDPAILALTILGFALACVRLGAKSMWLDETVSAQHAMLSLHALWGVVTRTDPDMGLYYVLLHFWVAVFGPGEIAIRSMSVVLAGLAVPVMALLGERLLDRRVGLLAALLLAVSPLFVRYEQTARSYGLLVLLVLLSMYFFLGALERPSRANLIAYVIASALAVYAHYFTALVLLVQLLTLLALRARGAPARPWVLAAVALLVLCAPEVVFAARAGSGGISWIPVPTLDTLVHFPSSLAGDGVLAALLAALGVYALLCARGEAERWRVWMLAMWLVLPVALDVLVSELGRPLFETYYLIIVLPPALLLGAWGALRLRPPALAGAGAMALVAFSVIGLAQWYSLPSLEEFRGATRRILAGQRPGDAIAGDPAKAVSFGVAYYEHLAGAAGPTRVRLTPAGGLSSSPPRAWIVIRDSDVTPAERGLVGMGMERQYRSLGAPEHLRGLTLMLYARRLPRDRARG